MASSYSDVATNIGITLEKNESDKEAKVPKLNTSTQPETSIASLEFPSDSSTNDVSKDDIKESNVVHVVEHYNSIEDCGITKRNQCRIVYMRNFNNWIKSVLIMKYIEKIREGNSHGSPIRALDMCCGKGGDLMKWRKSNLTHVICVDIASVSVEQCKARYNEMLERSKHDRRAPAMFTAEFLTYDCTKVRLREKYKDPSLMVDLVSCQFAFHYSFESLQQAECMLRNAAECLRPGGYFLLTIPDAYELVSRWQKCDGNKFGNDLYTVEFQLDKTKTVPLFGAKYNFSLKGLVDCPEFLVHRPTLCKLALKFGLECVMFERFEDYYNQQKNYGRTLLGRMQALETYPPFTDTSLLGENADDYKHAEQYKKNSSNHVKIGTLSRSEWDAATLYGVMAFKKMKTLWNREGKPEYTKL